MKLLLDTHVFLWYTTADPKLPSAYLAALRNPANEVYLSAASVWEAVIKYALGKLPLPAPPHSFMPQRRVTYGFSTLPVDEAAMPHLAGLPPLHRDPFDRILVAQALQYGMTIATVDAAVTAHPVPVLPPN